MQLLDLPLELFQNIIKQYTYDAVTELGFGHAWKRRAVCKLFRETIEYMVLAKQPYKDFLRTGRLNGRRVMDNNMVHYLKYRVRSRNGALPFLPKYTIRMQQWLLQGTDDAKNSLKQIQYEDKISRAFAGSFSGCYFFTKVSHTTIQLRGQLPYFDDVHVINRLAAAAAVGDYKIVQALLKEGPDLLWRSSYVFGYPLAAAAVGGQLGLVKDIFKDFEVRHRNMLGLAWEDIFQQAINAALICRNSDVVLFLLHGYDKYFPAITSAMCADWERKAARALDNNALEALGKMGDAKDYRLYVAKTKRICKTGDIAGLRKLVEGNNFRLNRGYDWPRACPLVTAIEADSIKLVREIMVLGANSNGVFTPFPAEWPLWRAISSNNGEMVDLLLSGGANPDFILHGWDVATTAFRRDRSDIALALREALAAKSRAGE